MKLRLLSLIGTWLAGAVAWAQPAFLFEPVDQSVSPGAPVLLQGVAYGFGPIEYQWYKDDEALPGYTADFLYIPAASEADAGQYFLVATSLSLSTTSSVAILSIDDTFTKVTSGALVDLPTISAGAAWNDYDNDGDPDVFIVRAGLAPNELYRNDGDGVFALVASEALQSELAESLGAAWADYNNDGNLDLLVINSGTNRLYRNDGAGVFSLASSGALGAEPIDATCAAWGDYNGDGWLDVYVGNAFGANFLYANTTTGTFARVVTPPFGPMGFAITGSAAWGDSDNDGDADLLVGRQGFGTFLPAHEDLFVNNGGGVFIPLTDDPLVTSGGTAISAVWVDYDNDLDLDAFLVNASGENSALFRNEGTNRFVQAMAGDLTINGEEGGQLGGCAWGDYDNDGWQDVFITNIEGHNSLYRNNGNGTFTRALTGSPASDGGYSLTAAWVDYDRDGFLDLHVANASQSDVLYRNNGNENAWLSVRCAAFNANRFGVGAKVKVLAVIGGNPVWQMREIAARDGFGSPSTLEAHFGLGDASTIELVRVEWPGGAVHEQANVAVNQFLVVGEPSIAARAVTLPEGDSGPRAVQIPVLLGAPTNGPVTVEYYTRSGTALAGTDYFPTNGILTFQPDQTALSVDIILVGDLLDEQDETLFLVLTNATGVNIGSAEARLTIADDDPVMVAVNDLQVIEGNSGTTDAIYTVFLSKPSTNVVSATFRTQNFTGVAGVDYLPIPSGLVVFEPGETSKPVVVDVVGDVVNEPTRGFGFRLLTATNATPNRRTALCTIIDDDPLPALRVVDSVVWEAAPGMASFSVEVVGQYSRPINVEYFTTDNTAEAPGDYLASSGMIVIPAGAETHTLPVPIQNDGIPEPVETFFLQLRWPVNATLLRDRGVARILDDDILATPPEASPQGFRFAFLAVRGMRYLVEWRGNLHDDLPWTPLPGYENVAGSGALVEVLDPDSLGDPQRFYRISALGP